MVGATWLLLAVGAGHAAEIRIGVFDLFQPRLLRLRASSVSVGAERALLRGEAELSVQGDVIVCRIGGRELRGARLTAEGPEVWLSAPGKLDRSYRGSLEVTVSSEALRPVAVMDLETAVGSVVAAEMPNAPLEALKAQAIAARSYFHAARGRHSGFDFCDTTHCQWVQGAPGPGDAAMRAVKETRGLTLVYGGAVLAAMYFRSCSGRTLQAIDVKLDPVPYPYFEVECETCRRQPYLWETRVAAEDAAALLAGGPSESLRLQLARRIGWTRLPSNTYSVERAGDSVVFRGKGEGHGLGLCQRGAIGMARNGIAAAEILRHYYPGATVGR